jgi:hypothetical protein
MLNGPAKRSAIVAAAALFSALYSVYYIRVGVGLTRPDFDQFWGAGRALVAGLDPYTAVGPGRWFEFHFPLYYPLPAVLVLGLPLAWLPIVAARAVFCACCAGVFALALTRHNDLSRAPALLSMSMLNAIQFGQFAPLFAAAIAYPWLGGLVAAKPTSGLAAVAAQHTRRGVLIATAVALGLTVISLVVMPAWPARWLSIAITNPARPPLLGVGAVLLLAALRWRRSEARWLLALAVAPITSPLYESLPLFMAPLTFRQALILALLTHFARWVMFLAPPPATFVDRIHIDATITITLVYVPALWWLLRRPNVGQDVAPA